MLVQGEVNYADLYFSDTTGQPIHATSEKAQIEVQMIPAFSLSG